MNSCVTKIKKISITLSIGRYLNRLWDVGHFSVFSSLISFVQYIEFRRRKGRNQIYLPSCDQSFQTANAKIPHPESLLRKAVEISESDDCGFFVIIFSFTHIIYNLSHLVHFLS